MKNINIAGTFQQYIESIATEIRRLLDWEYIVTVEEIKQNGYIPALGIMINKYLGEFVCFSITEYEFEKNKYNPEALNNLIQVKFINFIIDPCGIFSESELTKQIRK